MAEISQEDISSALKRYPRHAVFARVEDDRLDTLPGAFEDGSYLWKDVEWVVRWYCRRPLQHRDQSPEQHFRNNQMETIRRRIDQVLEQEQTEDKLDALTTLEGVDIPIATAFLQFINPERYVALDHRVWRSLVDSGDLSQSYPSPPLDLDYTRFLTTCQDIADTGDLRVVDVGRALWVIDVETYPPRDAGRHG